jgi:hypothetical protein
MSYVYVYMNIYIYSACVVVNLQVLQRFAPVRMYVCTNVCMCVSCAQHTFRMQRSMWSLSGNVLLCVYIYTHLYVNVYMNSSSRENIKLAIDAHLKRKYAYEHIYIYIYILYIYIHTYIQVNDLDSLTRNVQGNIAVVDRRVQVRYIACIYARICMDVCPGSVQGHIAVVNRRVQMQ